jgi:hypothetical protein
MYHRVSRYYVSELELFKSSITKLSFNDLQIELEFLTSNDLNLDEADYFFKDVNWDTKVRIIQDRIEYLLEKDEY